MSHPLPSPPTLLAPPPRLYLGCLALALGLQLCWPLPLGMPLDGRLALGIGLGGVSAALARWAFATLRRAGTSGNPRQDSQQLVRHGPFAWSRNPVYVAMTGLYASLAVLADSAWFWWLLPPLLLAIHHGVIRREETYLLARFGPPYADYLQQVRRWL